MSMRRNPALIASLRAQGQNVLADQLELEMPDDGDGNPDTIMAPGGVEISLVDPWPELRTIVRSMPRERQRKLLEQLKS